MNIGANPIIYEKYKFCPALIIDEKVLPKEISRTAMAFGAWADRYVSFSRHEFHLKKDRLRKIEVESYAWKTAFKILSYVLSLFILPALALISKAIYKDFCSENIKSYYHKPKVVNKVFASYKIDKTKISLKTGSVTQDMSDVLVNAANSNLLAGAGVCGAFNKDAGKEIFDECTHIKKALNKDSIPVGHAVMTTSGALKHTQAVIHAVGPQGSDAEREKLMADVINNSLKDSGRY